MGKNKLGFHLPAVLTLAVANSVLLKKHYIDYADTNSKVYGG